jgi:hypothetical protein
MKANELRVNNWCQSPYEEEPFKIKAEHILQLEQGMDELSILGISLTPEILVKAGFVKKGKRYSKNWFYLWSDDYNIVFALAQMEESIGKYLNIEYVHQLQNLYFALTGDELNIQL